MKTYGKIIICIIVVLLAIGVAYLIKNKNNDKDDLITNLTSNETKNELNNTVDQVPTDEYIGLEEKVEIEEFEPEEPEENVEEDPKGQEQQKQPEPELTGEEKAVDIVKKQYAMAGQTVRFDHMEGSNYVIKVNAGTAVTWYLVNGTTWEAEEY